MFNINDKINFKLKIDDATLAGIIEDKTYSINVCLNTTLVRNMLINNYVIEQTVYVIPNIQINLSQNAYNKYNINDAYMLSDTDIIGCPDIGKEIGITFSIDNVYFEWQEHYAIGNIISKDIKYKIYGQWFNDLVPTIEEIDTRQKGELYSNISSSLVVAR